MLHNKVYDEARVQALEKEIKRLKKHIENLEARLEVHQRTLDEVYLYI